MQQSSQSTLGFNEGADAEVHEGEGGSSDEAAGTCIAIPREHSNSESKANLLLLHDMKSCMDTQYLWCIA